MNRYMNFPLGDSKKLGWELRGVNTGAGTISPVPSLDASRGLQAGMSILVYQADGIIHKVSLV
ncbi:MAG: hypothetical protein DMG23_06175 [Acidobacteria bacterium]|nr:MAG: hypothetical protein DMG23_06175 [Acidobacteriota bacterium]